MHDILSLGNCRIQRRRRICGFLSRVAGYITCGETIEIALENALGAKKAWDEVTLDEGVEIHKPDSLENYSGQFKLWISKNLRRSLAEHDQREGMSMDQNCLYLLSRNHEKFSK